MTLLWLADEATKDTPGLRGVVMVGFIFAVAAWLFGSDNNKRK